MFAKIAGFELRYQLRQPIFWVVAVLFFLFTFGSVASDNIHIGDTANIHKNAPFAIIQVTEIWTLFFGMFVTTAFVANVVVRDDETGFGPIVRATRMSKFDYLYGRFVGAYLAAAIAFLSVPLAIWIGSLMPWLDPETLGPNRFGDYAWAYLVVGLPGLFLTSALFFAVASVTRSMMNTYLAVVGVLIVYLVVMAMSARKPELRHVMAWFEPFGFAALGDVMRYWTAAERNSMLPAFSGELLGNRLLWIGVGLALLAATWSLFRFSVRGAKARKAQKLAAAAEAGPAAAPVASGPTPRPVFGTATAWAQLGARTRFDMAQVFKSPAFLVLVLLGVFNSAAGLLFAGEIYGVDTYPVTREVIATLRGSFTIIPFIIAVYYAGELVWRDRDRKTHEIIDATAAPDWSFLVPKTLAIALVLIATLVFGALTGIAVQAVKGYTQFELGHYLVWFILPAAANAFLIAVLAVFLQCLVPHKFLGWAAMIAFLIITMVASNLGWDDNLIIYAGEPEVPLSDMNGVGRFWEARTWFQAYWGAFAVMLLVLGYGLWRRGTETRLRPRLARLPLQLRGAAGAILACAAVAFAGLGAWIFLNTHVWNEYRTHIDDEKRQAEFEKTLIRYVDLPQPTITDVKLDVDLRPHAPEAVTRGVYSLVNATAAPMWEVHVHTDFDTDLRKAAIPGATLEKSWPKLHYWIYRLAQPLQPGARTTLTFETWRGQKGFKNDGYRTRIVDNGTFLNNFEIAPELGLSREELLQDRIKRRKYHLQPEQIRLPKLSEDPAQRQRNYLLNAAWVNGDVTVTTDAGQTPLAPGYKVADYVKGGRRTAEFKTDAPILNFFSIQSARYAEKHETYKGVDIGVYYDPKHPWNVDRMIKAAKAGLDVYQPSFSPYQFRQLRYIEFPAYASFAQSFANTVPWSESLGFIADVRDKNKIDYVTYVGDHELGHQWWAHQVIGAEMQGETVLSETQAQYSALLVMEKLYGPDKIRRFLKYELDNYLRSRGAEAIEELPLEKVENQPYIHYRKGALIMYLLKDQIGEDHVNAALRKVLGQYAFKGAPYPTGLDLVKAIRAEAPADKQDLITDLFERITLYDVKAKSAEVKKRPDGKWDVRLTVVAKKFYADGKGKETPAAMTNESYDFGLFSAKPGEGAFGSKDVILFQRLPLSSGTHVYSFVADRKPTWAGVDPYNKRIDRNSDDNLVQATP
jgi:aminopeptidase N